MQSNYKPLGDYIQQVNARNKDLSITSPMGISINKVFMPSVANINGTDLSKYRMVSKNQFAYNPMHVGRDEVLPIALLQSVDIIIVSPAYVIFEIMDHEVLDPEYLMMWCTRSEFDRNAWFTTDSTVRGGFSWNSLCEMKLPVPPIEKQRENVKEYNTIVNRIKLNEQLNQKLEETAQALYKHWFVDFEFPGNLGDNSLNEADGYKSSGGKMVYNVELKKEIPKGWELILLGDILTDKGYVRGPFGSALKKDDMVKSGIPVYEQQHVIDNHRKFRYFITEEKHKSLYRFTVQTNDVVISCSGTLGRIAMIKHNDTKGVINQALLILRPDLKKIRPFCFKYYLTSNEGNNLLIENSSGSAQVNIAKKEVIKSIPFILPSDNVQNSMEPILSTVGKRIILLEKEIDNLIKFKNIILSKMTKVELEQSKNQLRQLEEALV